MSDVQKKKYDPVPEGEYLIKMTDFNIKDSKSGGKYIRATFTIMDGDHKNRLIWQNFNIVNKSEISQQISREQIDKYLKSIRVNEGIEVLGEDFTNLEKFLESPCIGRVKIQPANGRTYVNKDGVTCNANDENKITSFTAR